ncbi:MAG: efflux RND transporter permease subunit [Thermoplasmatota archaeon]
MANPFAAAASWSASHPVWTILLSLAIAMGTGAGMGQAEEGRITELFVPDDLPALEVQRDIEAIWGESEATFFLYLADDPTDPDLLRATAADMQRLAALDEVDAVIGLASLLEQQLGDLDDAPDATIQAAAAELQGTEAGKPFIADDALLVRITFPPADDVTTMTELLDGVAAQSAADADLRTAGILYVEQYQQEGAGGDVAFLMPLSLVVIILVLSLLFRRFQDVAVPLFTVLLAVIMAYGTVAWTGLPLAPPSFIVMPLLLGLGIDYMLHIVYAYREQPAQERVSTRFHATGRHVGYPVFFTAITTLIGFGSFLVSNIPQIRTWGLLIGSGALYAFILGFTFMPALYRIRRKKQRQTRLPLEHAMAGMTRFVMGHRKSVLAAVLVVSTGLFASAAFVDIESDIEFEPDEGEPAVANLNAVQDRFGGQSITAFLIESSGHDRTELAAFEQELAQSPFTGFVDGPTNRLARAGIPDGPLIGPATEGVATEDHWLVTVGYLFEDEDAALDAFEAIAADSGLEPGLTGTGFMDRESRENFLPAVAKSSLIALGLVVVLLAAIFRRPGPASLAFLPLVVAVGWQIGIMNLVGIPINPITGVMTAMILGVGVDYSLHIMSHFQEDRRKGRSSYDAAYAAMRSVGRPVLAASLTTVFAFSVLAFSSLLPLRDFGLVASIAIASAFVVSLTLLPILASYLPTPRAGSAQAPVAKARPLVQRSSVVYARPDIAAKPWTDVVKPRFADPEVQAWYDAANRDMK